MPPLHARACYGPTALNSSSVNATVLLQISVVVRAFHYSPRTALAVGLSMAQIGEFAFVLLSVASQLGLLPYQVYMLLMGAPLLLSRSVQCAWCAATDGCCQPAPAACIDVTIPVSCPATICS